MAQPTIENDCYGQRFFAAFFAAGFATAFGARLTADFALALVGTFLAAAALPDGFADGLA